jgi:hypothetical protein
VVGYVQQQGVTTALIFVGAPLLLPDDRFIGCGQDLAEGEHHGGRQVGRGVVVEEADDLVVEIEPDEGELHAVVVVEIEQGELVDGLALDADVAVDGLQKMAAVEIVFELYGFEQSGEVVRAVEGFLLGRNVEILQHGCLYLTRAHLLVQENSVVQHHQLYEVVAEFGVRQVLSKEIDEGGFQEILLAKGLGYQFIEFLLGHGLELPLLQFVLGTTD